VINRVLFSVLLVAFFVIILPFTAFLKGRPVAVKLGYLPEAEVIRMISGDHRYLLSEFTVIKVLFYFGSLIEKQKNNIIIQPEYYNMFKSLETSVKLDPYNMDAYYFLQAAFTWEIGRASDVNRVLLYGMKYRDWDWYLPFFVGFNSAYFLKDYKTAAESMQKAAVLSGNPLLTTLASRYFYEARQNDFGIMFIDAMEKSAKDKKVKDVYALRKKALLAVKQLSDAVERYKTEKGTLPLKLTDLVAAGYIKELPVDPYGGSFYLEAGGMIRSTSKFAFGSAK
jgi:hypothetical protein